MLAKSTSLSRFPALAGALLAALSCASAAAGSEPAARGPIELQDVFLPAQLRNQPYAESARILDEDAWELRSSADWTSHLAAADDYLLDGESVSLLFRIRYGLAPRWEVGLDVPYTDRTGGTLDALIESVEELLGAQVEERLLLPRNRFRGIISRGDEPLLVFDDSDRFGDLALRAKYQWLTREAAGSDLALGASLTLPTGGRGFGGRGTSGGLGLHWQRPRGALDPFAGVALVVHSDPREDGFRLQRGRGTVYFGLEWRLHRRISLVGQYQIYSALASAQPPLDAPGHYYALAARFALARLGDLELGVVENIGWIENRNSSDVTFRFALAHRF